MNDNIPAGYDSEGRYTAGLPERESDGEIDAAHVNDVLEVSRTLPYSVTVKTDSGHITICQGRVTSRAGYATPVELRKAFKKFYAITNSL